MKILSGFFVLLVLIPVICFALSNGQGVEVGLWPFDDKLAVPLYAVGLAPLGVGLIFGGFWGWITGVPHRLKSRRLVKEVKGLNAKMTDLRSSSSLPSEVAPSKKYFWERKS